MEKSTNFKKTAEQIEFVMTHECFDHTEVNLAKTIIQDTYTTWGRMLYDKSFMNLGLWDKKIYNEYLKLNYDFSALCNVQDIYSRLHLYYIISPLIKAHFFNKRMLEIGCCNGIGLKASSQLLKTNYALGIDLVNESVTRATKNFYLEEKVNYIQSDAESLPLENESFDIITNIESSHLYPRIEHFFAEVERVLAPGGYFCYADHNAPHKAQAAKFEAFLKQHKNLKVIQKHNITKKVQASIYQRIIVNEENFYNLAIYLFGHDIETLATESVYLAYTMGLIFLPWWKIRFKKPELQYIAKSARGEKFWGKKYYFYYLIQKVES